MEKMLLFLFVAVLLAVRNIIQKKYPEKHEQYAKTGKIIWTTLSIGLIGFMGFSAWYMFAKSNAGTETKIFNILATFGIIICFIVLTVSTWRKKK